MEALKVGDVVQLKSGSPKMTIVDTNDSHYQVACVWFDNGKQVYGSFPAESLKLVTD